jgi:hypothetical protein
MKLRVYDIAKSDETTFFKYTIELWNNKKHECTFEGVSSLAYIKSLMFLASRNKYKYTVLLTLASKKQIDNEWRK